MIVGHTFQMRLLCILLNLYLSGDRSAFSGISSDRRHRIAVAYRMSVARNAADILTASDRTENITVLDRRHRLTCNTTDIVSAGTLCHSVCIGFIHDAMRHISDDTSDTVTLCRHITAVRTVVKDILRSILLTDRELHGTCRIAFRIILIQSHRTGNAADIDISPDLSVIHTACNFSESCRQDTQLRHIRINIIKAVVGKFRYSLICHRIDLIDLIADRTQIVINLRRVIPGMIGKSSDAVTHPVQLTVKLINAAVPAAVDLYQLQIGLGI